jgi:hypothetical protein
MPYAHVEFAGGDAFRCLRISDEKSDEKVDDFGSTFCLQLGVAWDISRREPVNGVLEKETEHFNDLQEKLNARVYQAQSTHTEVEGLEMPKPTSEEAIAQNEESRNKIMGPLLDAQRAETEMAPRLHQFWVVTVLRKTTDVYLIVHGAYPDQIAAEAQARAVIDADVVNEVDVLSARSWFALVDFNTVDLARTTYVNDEVLNSTMRNAHWKSEMAKAVAERAKSAGLDLPPPDRPGFVMNPEVSASIRAYD